MRKRVYIALVIVLVALVSVMVWQGLREREPVYQGKSLRVWLREYPLGENTGTSKMAEDAVRHIGTNAIPTLLEMLVAKDSKLKDLWDRHIPKLQFLPSWVRYPHWHNYDARTVNIEAHLGFKILGADAKQAVPALMKLYERNISPSSQRAAGRSLTAIGPAARIAIPVFVQGAASSNESVRRNAVEALFEIHAEPRLVVPAFVKCLSDTNFSVRMLAVMGLAGFGTNAQAAVPALVSMLRAPEELLRINATNALKCIDPEAAVKAGMK
jgi:hypothetical protein